MREANTLNLSYRLPRPFLTKLDQHRFVVLNQVDSVSNAIYRCGINDDHMHQLGLLDLTDDALRAVLAWLPPQQLCRTALVSRKLARLCVEDQLWQTHTANWCGSSAGETSGLLPGGEQHLRNVLGFTTFRHVFQVLHKLGGWPVGLWQRADAGSVPYGELLQVQPLTSGASGFQGRIINPRGAVADGMFVIRVAGQQGIEAGVRVHIYSAIEGQFGVAPHGQELALIVPPLPEALLRRQERSSNGITNGLAAAALQLGQVQPAEPSTAVHDDDQEQLQAPWAAGALSAAQQQALAHALGIGALAWDHIQQSWVRMPHPIDSQHQRLEFHRLPDFGPPPSVLKPLPRLPYGEFPRFAALQRLEGLWVGCFGTHGLEILLLRFVPPETPIPFRCPTTRGPRLEAFKVTGDVNVPAGKFSVVADAEAVLLGPYDGHEGIPGAGFRPIVSFQEEGMQFVDLSERPILARYAAVGQMNFVPGVWDPTWAPGQVLIYEDNAAGFSMLFDDDGEQFRHVIDFSPFQPPV